MPVPVLKPTNVQDETFAQVTYHVQGEIVPVLVTEVGSNPVYFEHNVLLWKDPNLNVVVKPLGGGFKRLIAGMPLVMVETSGHGRIGFSRDGAGHVFGIHLERGQAIDVREHQWLAATATLDYTFQRIKGIANIMLSGTGFFIDTFRCSGPEGILWLHGYGNVFEINLAPGEVIDIEPGAWIYKDQSVRMETVAQKLATGLFASGGQFVFNRFFGPGRIGMQSMSMLLATENN